MTREELIIENFELKLKLEAYKKYCDYQEGNYQFLLEMYGNYDSMAFSVAEEIKCNHIFSDIQELKDTITHTYIKVRNINENFNKFRANFRNNGAEKIYKVIRD